MKTSTTTSYQYQPLSDQNSIRILEVLPGDHDDEVRYNLHVASLDRLPPYEAISYVWGSASDRPNILCHGKHIAITRNLDTTLRRFRLTNRPRMLWADAVCINQDDLGERARQVLLMGAIYRNASRVLVWLGLDEHNHAAKVFDVIKPLASILSKPQYETTETNRFFGDEFNEQWESFTELLKKDWFRRLWILQEIGLAADALLVCGDAEIPWDAFAKVCDFLNSGTGESADFAAFNAGLNGLIRVAAMGIMNFKSGSNMHVGEVLHMARNAMCTNKHDKIYGLFGHATFEKFCSERQLESFITVDYTKSYFDTYFEAAKRLLEGPEPLYCLSLVQQSSRTLAFADKCSSWAPQWNRRLVGSLYEEFENHLTSRSTVPQFSIQGRALHVRGVQVDSIEYCSKGIQLGTLLQVVEVGEPKDQSEHPFMTTWKMLEKSNKRHLSEEQMFRELCNALNAGVLKSDEGRRQSTVTEEEYLCDSFAYFDRLGIPFSNPQELRTIFGDKNHNDRFLRTTGYVSRTRCLFITKAGYVGLGPDVMKPNDAVCVLFGSPMPFVLHPKDPTPGRLGNEYLFCGESYVHGMMKGEAIESWRKGCLVDREFRIV